jgi:hypothetical protein
MYAYSAAEVIYEAVDQDANIIFGALVDDKITNGEVSITVLATGFSTDFFDPEAEEGSGKGLESLQPTKVSTPKTVSAAKQFAEKPLVPPALEQSTGAASKAGPKVRYTIEGADEEKLKASSGAAGDQKGKKKTGFRASVKKFFRNLLADD